MHLFDNLCLTLRHYGYRHKIIEDSFGNSISNLGLIYKSILISIIYKKKLKKENTVAILMPNIVVTSVLFFSIQYLNKVVSIINFTSGLKNIISSLKISKIKTIITSRKFIEQLDMHDAIKKINEEVKVLYIDDIKSEISLFLKIKAAKELIFYLLYSYALFNYIFSCFSSQVKRNANDPALILYTSGTESSPKGVVLSHKNLYINRSQVLRSLDLNSKKNKIEKFFTCLPFFHSFGIGIGVLLPILNGHKVFLYPTPLHYKAIPSLLEKSKASIFFSTNTFLKKYKNYFKKENFKYIKYLIAGAEKLDEEIYSYYKNKFNIKILEGYGVTEASPAVSVNTYDNFRLGSVGKILYGIDYKIEKIDGYNKGGLLYIKGDNIMLGYQNENNFQKIDIKNNWYNTGDIAFVDDDGFLFILGRLKRFAKIAGEMISLVQIEEFPKKLWPEYNHGICSVLDSAKGEALVFLTDNKEADIVKLNSFMKDSGFSNLYFPKKIKIVSVFPILGSGKIDFKKLQELAEI